MSIGIMFRFTKTIRGNNIVKLSSIVPNFIKNIYHHYKIQKRFGKKANNILTVDVALDAVLGTGIYLARDVDIRNKVIIGDYSYCSRGTVVFNRTQIGKFCSIGYNVQIGVPEHPASFMSTSPRIYRETSISELLHWPKDDIISPVVIGNDVWIGSNVIILQGITIGDGAVIGAGAVVTKDVEPFTIVGGVPAKVIRKRFDYDMQKAISDSQWWNLEIKEIEKFAYRLYLGEKEK